MIKTETKLFLDNIIQEIEKRDSLQSQRLKKDIDQIINIDIEQFEDLVLLIYNYFHALNINESGIVTDYLKMVNDMRIQRYYFLKQGKYSCENQKMAYDQVYSNNDIMSYYMNGLLISQLLWKHHFNMFVYFKMQLKNHVKTDEEINILDVGPGHGFYTNIVMNSFKSFKNIDIVDVSESSIMMTQDVLGKDCRKINYYNQDVLCFNPDRKYDLIILGEVIEHLDNPHEILKKLSNLLSPNGIIWVTTPTNAPAIDHVYLFRNKEEIIDLIHKSNLEVESIIGFYSDDVSDETAKKNKVTQLIGAFCRRDSHNDN